MGNMSVELPMEIMKGILVKRVYMVTSQRYSEHKVSLVD